MSSHDSLEICPDPDIEDVYYLESIEQLKAISDPIRYRMIVMMTPTPMTGAQLARALDMSRSRAHYHLKLLEKVGLVKFCGEATPQGILEKYYHAVGRMLDYSKLIPMDQEDLVIDELTLESFQVVTEFLATLLDVSRASIYMSGEHRKVTEGFYFDFASVLTPDQFNHVKKELRSIREYIIETTRNNEKEINHRVNSEIDFRATIFLTPLSESNINS